MPFAPVMQTRIATPNRRAQALHIKRVKTEWEDSVGLHIGRFTFSVPTEGKIRAEDKWQIVWNKGKGSLALRLCHNQAREISLTPGRYSPESLIPFGIEPSVVLTLVSAFAKYTEKDPYRGKKNTAILACSSVAILPIDRDQILVNLHLDPTYKPTDRENTRHAIEIRIAYALQP